MNTDKVYIDREPEFWLPIMGYEGKYEISSWGNIMSIGYNNTKEPKQLVLMEDKDGYMTITLCMNGTKKLLKISRLVGLHFIPNPYNLPEVNHLFGNKKDNYYKHLEWSTRSDNILHAIRTGLRPRTTEKQIAAVRLTNQKKRGMKYATR